MYVITTFSPSSVDFLCFLVDRQKPLVLVSQSVFQLTLPYKVPRKYFLTLDKQNKRKVQNFTSRLDVDGRTKKFLHIFDREHISKIIEKEFHYSETQ